MNDKHQIFGSDGNARRQSGCCRAGCRVSKCRGRGRGRTGQCGCHGSGYYQADHYGLVILVALSSRNVGWMSALRTSLHPPHVASGEGEPPY